MGSETVRHAVAVERSGPPLPDMFARYKGRMEEELLRAVPDTLGSQIYLLLRYHLGWVDQQGREAATAVSQGKALRPTLCLFGCEALGGDPSRAVSAAAALELIHNFSLIHDDIQDQDRERRHHPTVWYLWGAPQALVAGDAMQSLGDLSLLGSVGKGISPYTTLRVSNLLTESYLEMIEGQCLDLGFESRTAIATGDYLHMIACKTGALIRSALEIGAMLATDDPDATSAFSRFGSSLGRAFQIRDDYLGIWGDVTDTGKATGNDIRRRKKSLPVVYALEQATGPDREELDRIYRQNHLDEADVDRVLAALDGVGAAEYCQRLTEESAARALEAVAPLSLPEWARSEIDNLVDFLARRTF